MPLIEVDRLDVRYGNLYAVQSASFTVGQSGVYGLLGQNGAGKSSTISALAGLLSPAGGECRVQGLPVQPGKSRLRSLLALQPQRASLLPRLKVRETLEMWAALYPEPRGVAETIEALGLTDKAGSRVATLSGGQQQRLLLGTALIGNTPVVVLDEPTAGLDPHASGLIKRIIRSARTSGTTFLLSTHNMPEAEEICDRVAIMQQGRIVAEGAPAALVDGHCPGETVIAENCPPRIAVLAEHEFGADFVARSRSVPTDSTEHVKVRTRDPVRAAEWLTRRNGDMRVYSRPSNLEDVFLKVTEPVGRTGEYEGAR